MINELVGPMPKDLKMMAELRPVCISASRLDIWPGISASCCSQYFLKKLWNSLCCINHKNDIQESLNLMQMENIGVLYAHVYDEEIFLKELCREFRQIVKNGHAFY